MLKIQLKNFVKALLKQRSYQNKGVIKIKELLKQRSYQNKGVIKIKELLKQRSDQKIKIQIMLKIIGKHVIPIDKIKSSQQILNLNIKPKYIKTLLDFDGSMTKFVMNLSEGVNKPLIKIIQQKQITIPNQSTQSTPQSTSQLSQFSYSQQTLIDLKKVFNTKSQNKQTQKANKLIQRSIQFYLLNQDNQSTKPKLLYFARSFWNKQKYQHIMSKNHLKPIGLNLIQQQIQIFRKINWTGLVDLSIISQSSNNQILNYSNLCSRSYSMISDKSTICELQEYFIPSVFDMFLQK